MPELKPLVISELKPPLRITLVQDSVGLEKLSKWAEHAEVVGLDTETNVATDFYFRKVRTIQLGDKDEQFVIDLLAFAGSEEKLCESQGFYGKNVEVYAPVFKVLDPILCTNQFLKVGQNLSYEYQVLNWCFGKRIWHLFSTDLAERVIQAGAISLKKYSEFSMAGIVARRFGFEIDKSLQELFDLKTPLTQAQIEYAALDIRMPLAIRLMQLKVMSRDQLTTTAQIENDAIGSFVDMHLNGWRLDKKRWLKRVEAVTQRRVGELKELDEGFIPIVGLKTEQIDFVELERREKIWREGFEVASSEEMDKAMAVRMERDKEQKLILKAELKSLEKERKEKKAAARKNFSELSKKHTEVKNELPKCEGEAFVNYASNTQLLDALKHFKGMHAITSVGDEVLLKFNDRPFIQVLRKYRKGKKDTGTYGVQWTQPWTTKPCKEQGWLHPWDGRLHCTFNQLEAETGRSSSSKPNAQNLPKDDEVRACFVCDPPDAEEPEGYSIVTVDMEGAELRIIAELANATSWINAFAKGQDVHSVSTEILEPEKWPVAACKGGEKWFDPKKKEEVILPPCAYYVKGPDGQSQKKKCECPGHAELRARTKAINFLLCYGGGPNALADDLGITVDVAKELMRLHEEKFPDVWGYLYRSGQSAKRNEEARDLCGRRRLLPPPTWEGSKEHFKDENEEKLRISDEDKERNLFNFKSTEMREPTKDEIYSLTHRRPTDDEIKQAMRGLAGSIERRGKNHCIQGSNASIIKRAMGCGFDKDGKPYLWHTLPQYKAKLLSMVHDELIVQVPKRFAEDVARLIADAFKRAAAEVMSKVVMTADWHIAERWMK